MRKQVRRERTYGAAPAFSQSRRALLAGAAALAFARPAQAGRRLRLLCLGDSLTAGYMLPPGDGFVPVLGARLKADGFDVVTIDAGVSGDTATAGLERLDWALGEGADAAIVELGANDMLRGIDPAVTRNALEAILTKLQAKGVRPILAGMRASPSLGPDYVNKFDAIYPDLAKAHGVPLYPFFLDGVTGVAGQTLADGLHPSPAGVRTIVAGIAPLVAAELRKIS